MHKANTFPTLQGELEHRSPKARYRRTDRKKFIKQLTQIERRQARIRRIKQQNSVNEANTKPSPPPEIALHPEQHHHIGKNENTYEEFGAFIRKHCDDPAVIVRFLMCYTSVLSHSHNYNLEFSS